MKDRWLQDSSDIVKAMRGSGLSELKGRRLGLAPLEERSAQAALETSVDPNGGGRRFVVDVDEGLDQRFPSIEMSPTETLT
jgi:hypothetical protein